jgi:hypothetical protein
MIHPAHFRPGQEQRADPPRVHDWQYWGKNL